jgi:hypothetical protein
MMLQETCPLCHQLHTPVCPPAPLWPPTEAPCNKHITCHFTFLTHSRSSLNTEEISSQTNTSQQNLRCVALKFCSSIPSYHAEISLQWGIFFLFKKGNADQTKIDNLNKKMCGFRHPSRCKWDPRLLRCVYW